MDLEQLRYFPFLGSHYAMAKLEKLLQGVKQLQT